jgi:hypothetical protein
VELIDITIASTMNKTSKRRISRNVECAILRGQFLLKSLLLCKYEKAEYAGCLIVLLFGWWGFEGGSRGRAANHCGNMWHRVSTHGRIRCSLCRDCAITFIILFCFAFVDHNNVKAAHIYRYLGAISLFRNKYDCSSAIT